MIIVDIIGLVVLALIFSLGLRKFMQGGFKFLQDLDKSDKKD